MNNSQVFSVFFKVESESHSVGEMKAFGQKCIRRSMPATIISTHHQQKEVTFIVQFKQYNDAERFIHDNIYKQHENGMRTLALWNGKKPRFEVFVSGGPKGLTRRDLFLAMEKFGEIGKATIKKSCDGSGWVSFINKSSYIDALNTAAYIGNARLKVSLNDGTVDSIPAPMEKKNVNFNELIE